MDFSVGDFRLLPAAVTVLVTLAFVVVVTETSGTVEVAGFAATDPNEKLAAADVLAVLDTVGILAKNEKGEEAEPLAAAVFAEPKPKL